MTRSRRLLLMSCLLLAGCVTTEGPSLAEHETALDRNTVIRLADRMRLQGDLPMAADFYQRAIAADPESAAAYYGLAETQAGLGQPAQAARTYREALRYDKGSDEAVDIRRDYAKLLLGMGDYSQAAQQYRLVLERRGRDARALNGLGVALDQMGDHAAAQGQYQQALDDNPEDMAALNNLGMSLIMAGHYQAAIARLEPAADAFKATPALRQNLALAYIKSGQSPRAEQLLERDLGPYEAAQVMQQLQYGGDVPAPMPAKRRGVRGQKLSAITPPPPPSPDAVFVPLGALPPVVPEPVARVSEPMPLAPAALPVALPTAQDPQAAAAPAVTAAAMPEPEAIDPAFPPKSIIRAAGKILPRTGAVEAVSHDPAPTSGEAEPETPMPANGAMTEKPLAAVAEPPALPEAAAPRAPTALLGPYATAAMAEARVALLRDAFAADLPENATTIMVMQLPQASGTPRFMLEVQGFSAAEERDGFCARLVLRQFDCQAL